MVFSYSYGLGDASPPIAGVGRAQSAAAQAQDEVRALENRLERMKLVTRALWEIVRDHTPITEAMLEAKVKQIDLRDGKADGRDGARISKCQKCGRTIQRGQDTCQYCGHVQGFESVFDWIR
ncbi:MAG: hypothetical protein EA402_11740 [Planctomycetota bacterium]|nr:MAG: hypothetical protein EA402_11740 [Planctomycetota bacterium]